MLDNSGMRYDMATNFDTAILDHIEKYDEKHQVASLFGKFKTDVIGGGRSSNTLPDITEKQLIDYNERCKKMGIHFNYLLNPMCLGNRDMLPVEHKKIIEFLKKLESYGIEWVTVNSPYLCEIIKKQFPKIHVTVGQYAVIQTIQQARQWVDLGADELTLSHNVNRDFDNLRNYLKVFKDTDIRMRVIANNGCLHDCPFSLNHAACVSHSSTPDGTATNCCIDYSIVNCYYRKLTKPTHLIASDWIRPEDVHYYKELCDETGNHNLVIKLVERSKPTAFLINLLDAFLHESYDGSLTELLNWLDERNSGSQTHIDASGYIEAVKNGELDLHSINYYIKTLQLPKIKIDNTKLNGFLEHFVHNYHCKEKICWLESYDPDERSDKYCYYCHDWAKKVITCEDQKEFDKWLKSVEKLKGNMVSSRIFCLDKEKGSK